MISKIIFILIIIRVLYFFPASRNYDEQLVAYENLRLDYDDLHIIISNQRIRIVTNLNGPNLTTIIVCHLR